MSTVATTVDCNIENQYIQDKEWNIIQEKAISSNMLQSDEDIKELIATDEKIILDAGIRFDQLRDYFNSFQKIVNCSKPAPISKRFIGKLSKFVNLNRDGWSLQGVLDYQIKCFGLDFDVIVYIWGGAAECPFQNKDLDKRYKGYNYGATDYCIARHDINEVIHIGSLLFHQIAEHHFFQSPKSDYRVDPYTLIRFFNIQPGVDYKIPIKIVKARRLHFGENKDKKNLFEMYKIENEGKNYKWDLIDENKDDLGTTICKLYKKVYINEPIKSKLNEIGLKSLEEEMQYGIYFNNFDESHDKYSIQVFNNVHYTISDYNTYYYESIYDKEMINV